MNQPKAVIFDMDGLLIDTERVALAAFLEAAAGLGIATTEDFFKTFIGKNWQTNQVLMRNALGSEDASRMLDAWPKAFEARVASYGIPKKPGADEVLTMLTERVVPIALATSTSRHHAVMQLQAVDLLDYFPVITTGDEVANGKPAPDIFLMTAERLRTEPASCVVLEDSEPGVAAASAAGMRVIMVPDLVRPSSEIAGLAEKVCDSLAEAHELLEAMLER
jgi:HAD superfamily hydrolase (TIGR01509 family)